LEQQLVPGGVLDAELHEHPGVRPQARLRVGLIDGLDAGEQLPVALGEHRVVHGVLGREVRIQRLGPHANLCAQVAHGDPDETLSRSELPRSVEDLAPGGSETLRAAVSDLVD
jgi:hypothetical protein